MIHKNLSFSQVLFFTSQLSFLEKNTTTSYFLEVVLFDNEFLSFRPGSLHKEKYDRINFKTSCNHCKG